MSEDTPFVAQKVIVKVGPDKEIDIELPRLTLKKIMLVTGAVEKLVKTAQEKSPQLFELFSKTGETDKNQLTMEVVKLIPALLPVIMEEVTEVIAIYIGKDKDWVQDNLDVEDLVAIGTPFFQNILQQGNHLLGPLANLFPKNEAEKASTEPSQT